MSDLGKVQDNVKSAQIMLFKPTFNWTKIDYNSTNIIAIHIYIDLELYEAE